MFKKLKRILALSLALLLIVEPMDCLAAEEPLYSFRSAIANFEDTYQPGEGALNDNFIYAKPFMEIQIIRIPTATFDNTTQIHDYAKGYTVSSDDGGNLWIGSPVNHSNSTSDGDTHLLNNVETQSALWVGSSNLYDINGNQFSNDRFGSGIISFVNEVYTTGNPLTPDSLIQVAEWLNKGGSMYCPQEYIDDMKRLRDSGYNISQAPYIYFASFQFHVVPCVSKDGRFYTLVSSNAKSNYIDYAWRTDTHQLISGNQHDYAVYRGMSSGESMANGAYNTLMDAADSIMNDTWTGYAYHASVFKDNEKVYKRLWEFMYTDKHDYDPACGKYLVNYVKPTTEYNHLGMYRTTVNTGGHGYWGIVGENIPIPHTYVIEWAMESKTQGASTDFKDGQKNVGQTALHIRPGNMKTYEDLKASNASNFRFKLYNSVPFDKDLTLKGVSNDYWAGSGGQIGSSDTFSNVVVNAGAKSVEFTVSKNGLLRLFDGGRILFEDWLGDDSYAYALNDTKWESKHNGTWTLELISADGWKTSETTVTSGTGKHPYDDTKPKWNFNGWVSAGTTGKNYISWIQVLGDKIPWEWHSNSGGGSYAEIVANDLTANTQDWAVMSGLPSTENLSIAVGGTCFAADLSGFINSQGVTGTYNKETVKRTITFNVNVNNYWGKEETENMPCPLKCPGHPYSVVDNKQNGTSHGCNGKWQCPVCLVEYKYSLGQHTDGGVCNKNDHSNCKHGPGIGTGTVPAENQLKKHTDAKEWSCWNGSKCTAPAGQCTEDCEALYEAGTPCDCTLLCKNYASCPCNTPGCKGTCSYHTSGDADRGHHSSGCAIGAQGCTIGYKEACKCDGNHDNTYTCTAHDAEELTYHCDTGKWDISGEVTSVTKISEQVVNGQAWASSIKVNMANGSRDSRNGTVYTYTVPSVLCQGYTSGYGCVHTEKLNCVHPTKKTYTWYIYEYLDKYAWREITNAKIYMLTHGTITDVNTDLLSSEYKGMTCSNANLVTDLWRGNGGWVNGSKRQNGRLWFTQFKNPEPTEYGTGFKAKVQGYDWSNSLVDTYWLTDCIVTIDVYADSSNMYTLDRHSFTERNFKENNGSKSGNFHDELVDSDESVWEYVNNKGDWEAKDTGGVYYNVEAQALKALHAWMRSNKGTLYTVNVISDTAYVGIEGGSAGATIAQDICADMYGVDAGKGIFDEGFTDDAINYKEYWHTSQYADPTALFQSNSMNFSNIFKSNAPFIFQGYLGTPATDPAKKYGVTGNSVDLGSAMCYALETCSGLGRFEGTNGVNLSAGSIRDANGGNSPYARTTPKSNIEAPGRLGKGRLTTNGSGSTKTFTGHYNTYSYVKGSYTPTISAEQANVYDTSLGITTNFSGQVGLGSYGVPIHFAGLEIKNYIPNGVYNHPVKVSVSLKKVLDMSNGGPALGDDRNTGFSAQYYSGYTNTAGEKHVLNDIVIHDPISVQYNQLLPNNYGAYTGSVYTTDESKEDMRLSTEGISNADKEDYIVLGNKFYIWDTDIGDLLKLTDEYWEVQAASNTAGVGSNALGCDVKTGAINSAADGYVNKMNTNKWIRKRTVTFTYPVSYINTSGKRVVVKPGTEIDLAYVKLEGTKYLDDKIGSFRGTVNSTNDMEFVYGRLYEFTCIESGTEGENSVTFKVYAKNSSTDTNKQAETTNVNKDRAGYTAADVVMKTVPVELVGRIGNLAIEDTEDFRFSNYFKKATNNWLIDNVVKKVDITVPNNIVSSVYDIIGSKALTEGHSTYSVTNYDKGSGGKAGDFSLLPLTSAVNSNNEFKGQELRLGYKLFMDIELMGNYSGYNYVKQGGAETSDNGPDSAEDTIDNRTNKVVITPRYMLYDFDQGKFYDIDMYCGNEGAYTLFYTEDSVVNNVSSSLYINLEEERERRNVPYAEYGATRAVTNRHGGNAVADALTEIDYIGTASQIVLDAYDRTFVGSSIKYGDVNGTYASSASDTVVNATSYSANGAKGSTDDVQSLSGRENFNVHTYNTLGGILTDKLSDISFATSSMRYHFTMGVPSSTIIVEQGVTGQSQIKASNEKLKGEHPNSVIVCFADIKAYGSVYTLHYDTELIMGNTNINIPVLTSDTLTTKVVNYTVPEVVGTGGKLTKYDVPMYVMDPWSSSTDDLEIYGTH